MKNIEKIVFGLLTASSAVLTNELTTGPLFSSDDKLLVTLLWCGWLIVAVYYYLQIFKAWKLSHTVVGGYIMGLGIAFEADQPRYDAAFARTLTIILPFMLIELTWTKLN
tara:strand:- start:414 stop:743 length:330 start_codon:yes stop_codon:yes gene_type:complete